MLNVEGNIIVKNNKLCNLRELTNDDKFIYEVIRIKNSHPVFADEHYYRMLSSNGNKFFGCTLDEFRADIGLLVQANDIHNCNIKVIYDGKDTYFMFIKSFYPDEQYHLFGATVVTANIVRENPNKKKYNHIYRTTADKIMNDNSAYEVLLVNNEGMITEGSKSNVFFVKDKIVYTAPDNLVLKGITRTKVIESIKELGVPIVMHPVKEEDVWNYDGAFLTGTSIDVFKIRKINDLVYDEEEEIISDIATLFQKKVDCE